MHGKRVVWRAYAKPYPTAVAPKQSEGADKSIDLTGGNSDGRKKRTKCNLSFKTFAAFTLAEILLSLTVIGIVAAIALPSLLGNANERAWETQKKALYTRFSQALPLLPSLNGYGELVGNLSDCDDTNSCHSDSELKDTAAESFVRDGLSKVMKITNICAIPFGKEGKEAAKYLGDCGLPDKIIPINGSTALKLSNITTLGNFNDAFNGKIDTNNFYAGSNTHDTYEQLNTNAAAFETVNGENILVYYNPNCEANIDINAKSFTNYNDMYFTQPKLCANFVYDLNGKKGPNTVGKDIGFITVIYSTDSVIVAPMPHTSALDRLKYQEAVAECKNLNENMKVPNIDEATSLFYNTKLLGYKFKGSWSSNSFSAGNNWYIGGTGRKTVFPTNVGYNTHCIKR